MTEYGDALEGALRALQRQSDDTATLRARIDAALFRYDWRSELFTDDAALIAAMVDALLGVECAHDWLVTQQGQTYWDQKCKKCGKTKRESWD